MSIGYLRALLITDPIIVLATIVLGTASLIASLFDASGNAQHRVARLWSRILLFVGCVRVHVSGLERLRGHDSYVLVANHLSLMDTPVVVAHIPLQFRFFAKQGLFRIPFLGTHLRRAGHFAVVRGDTRASLRSLTDGARLIRERHTSVLLFPEGGRSQGGLMPFKQGFAYLAIKSGVPVVPLGIAGTREILPMGSAYVRGGVARMRIGDPIPTEDLNIHDRERLTALVRGKIAELAGLPLEEPADVDHEHPEI